MLVAHKRPFAPSPIHFSRSSRFGAIPRSAASQQWGPTWRSLKRSGGLQPWHSSAKLKIVTLFARLSAPKSQRFLRFAIAMPIADPKNRSDFRNKRKQCCIAILWVRWKVASDLRFRAAISEPKTPSFCRISGDLAPSTRESPAIAIVRFWCAKLLTHSLFQNFCMAHLRSARLSW